ncbi:MAG: hypothetical protein R3C53_18040 [Pirellulaceae bacterium]
MHKARSFIFVLVALWLPCIAAAATPNVLVIITDEHNFRTLGCYRDLLPPAQAEMWGPGVVVPTPHIDSLAQQGSNLHACLCDVASLFALSFDHDYRPYPHAVGAPRTTEL